MLHLQAFTFNPFSENTYLVINDKKQCWIVDPGMYDAGERSQFNDYIASGGLQPQAIINTHAHIDHIFGVEDLMKRYDIPFYLHAAEGPVLASARGAAVMFGLEFGTIPAAEFSLVAGTPLKLGDDDVLELRLAPGHSPGSLVLYYAAGGWAIGGDVLFAGSVGRSDLPGGNHDTLIDSIRTQLLTLPDETKIYPGHGPATTIGTERRSNPFLR